MYLVAFCVWINISESVRQLLAKSIKVKLHSQHAQPHDFCRIEGLVYEASEWTTHVISTFQLQKVLCRDRSGEPMQMRVPSWNGNGLHHWRQILYAFLCVQNWYSLKPIMCCLHANDSCWMMLHFKEIFHFSLLLFSCADPFITLIYLRDAANPATHL